MTKREFLDIVFALAPTEANAIMDAFDEYVESAQLGTNLAEVGTDCISRQSAIDEIEYELEMINSALDSMLLNFNARERLRQRRGEVREILNSIQQLPSTQPEIIRCRNCKFASGDSRICMKFGHSPIGELDFCAWAERRTG